MNVKDLGVPLREELRGLGLTAASTMGSIDAANQTLP